MMRNYVKKPKNQYDDKEIQHGLQIVDNGASIQVEKPICCRNICRSTFLKFNRFLF